MRTLKGNEEKTSYFYHSNGMCFPTYLPAWCCKDGYAHDIETGRRLRHDPTSEQSAVYVRINGRQLEAKRCIGLWRVVAKLQWGFDYARDSFSRKAS